MTFEIIRDEDDLRTVFIIDGFQVSHEVYEIVTNYIKEKEKRRC